MITVEQVLLAGASGQTGQQVLRQLTRTDIEVRALTRSAAKIDRLQREGADDIVVVDLMSSDDARTAVEGMDAVFAAVGSSPQKILRGEEFVDGTGNINLVEAVVDAGDDTVVMVSSLGVGDDRNSWLAQSFRLVIRPVVAAKARAETALRDADLRHTILRPGVLMPTWLSARRNPHATDFVRIIAEGDPDPDATVGTSMSTDITTTTANESIQGVADLMIKYGFHHVPVVDEGQVIGVIMTTDLTAYLSSREEPSPS